MAALNTPGCGPPKRTDQNVGDCRVGCIESGCGNGLAEADVVLVPAGVVPRLVVAAGRAEDRRVALLLAHQTC